jgi:hypothetical protein
MKKMMITLIGLLIVGCFTVSEKTVKDFIVIRDSIKNEIIQSADNVQNKIEAITQNYKNQINNETASIVTSSENMQVQEAGIGEIFGCTPSKPKPMETTEIKPSVQETPPVPEKPIVVEKPIDIKKIEKATIIDVKTSSSLVKGRVMITSWKVKLNKTSIDKVKKGAKVRIFIDYCYYESGKIEKDGTVSFDIGWHPPIKGKVGVSLFTPNNGSGIQHCSMLIRI